MKLTGEHCLDEDMTLTAWLGDPLDAQEDGSHLCRIDLELDGQRYGIIYGVDDRDREPNVTMYGFVDIETHIAVARAVKRFIKRVQKKLDKERAKAEAR